MFSKKETVFSMSGRACCIHERFSAGHRGLYVTSERVYYFRGEQITHPEGYMHVCLNGYTAQQEDR